jgi:hypothetical protein
MHLVGGSTGESDEVSGKGHIVENYDVESEDDGLVHFLYSYKIFYFWEIKFQFPNRNLKNLKRNIHF